MTVETEVNRFLDAIRNKIRQQGFTQLRVQSRLGWGRSYISQLLTHQKSLRVSQLLAILETIGVEPAEFFRELYSGPYAAASQAAAGNGCENLRSTVAGLVQLLVDKGVVTPEELAAAGADPGSERRDDLTARGEAGSGERARLVRS